MEFRQTVGSRGVTSQEDFPPVFFGQQINQKSTRIFVSFYTDLSTVIVEQMNSFLDNDYQGNIIYSVMKINCFQLDSLIGCQLQMIDQLWAGRLLFK